MLPLLLPLVGKSGILGAALSGAGPAVLVVVGNEEKLEPAAAAIRDALGNLPKPELLVCRFVPEGTSQFLEAKMCQGF